MFWNTDNPTVVSVFDGTLVSGDVGTATISATWETCLWWVMDGQCDPVCDQRTEYSSSAVVPSISKIQYKGPNNSTFSDATATLYVLKGTAVTFKAIPDPAEATFPSGQPTWSGTSGATGSGQSTSVTFSTISSSTSNFKTVVATAGSAVKTVNVIVYELSSVLTPEDNFEGRSTDNFGLRELVNLSFAANPAITATQAGGLRWTRSTGPATGTVSSEDDGTGTFTAPDAGTATTLKLEVLDGPSKGRFITTDIATVAPSGARIIRTGNIKHTQGVWGGDFRAYIHFDPKNVSFKNIRFREHSCLATADGYLASWNGELHPATGASLAIGDCNLTTGCRASNYDTAYFAQPTPSTPYSNGSFNWPIPWAYYVTNDIFAEFTVANQTATSNSSGTAFIGKKDIGPFTVEVNDQTSDY